MYVGGEVAVLGSMKVVLGTTSAEGRGGNLLEAVHLEKQGVYEGII